MKNKLLPRLMASPKSDKEGEFFLKKMVVHLSAKT